MRIAAHIADGRSAGRGGGEVKGTKISIRRLIRSNVRRHCAASSHHGRKDVGVRSSVPRFLHPVAPRVGYDFDGNDVDLSDRLTVRLGPDTGAVSDRAWPAMLDADHLGPLNAIVRAVDGRFRCEAHSSDGDRLNVVVVMDDEEAPLADEVVLTRLSTGTDFAFEDRGTPVEIRRG
jgi:hypothetical protein